MLAFARLPGESILIGDPASNDVIVVCVHEVRGDKVKIGVSAPRDIIVDRLEISRRKEAASDWSFSGRLKSILTNIERLKKNDLLRHRDRATSRRPVEKDAT